MRVTNRQEFFGCLAFYELIGGLVLAMGILTGSTYGIVFGASIMAFFALLGTILLPGVLREPGGYTYIGKQHPAAVHSSSCATCVQARLPTPAALPAHTPTIRVAEGDAKPQYVDKAYEHGDDQCRICGDSADVGPYCGPHAP